MKRNVNRGWSKAGKPRSQSALDGREVEFLSIHKDHHDDVLAEMFSVSVVTIGKWRQRLGVKKGGSSPKRWGLEGREEEFKSIHSDYTDIKLGKIFGVSPSTIEKWRDRFGLKKSFEGRWQRQEHPRGFAGGSHTIEAKESIAAAARRMWSNPDHQVNSDEYRQMRSDRMAQLQANGNLRQGHSRCASGVRSDLGIFVRSSWEANYARYLNWLITLGEIHGWEYEPDTFWFEKIKRGVRSYTPDFKIWESPDSTPYYVEVKGWMDQKSRTKLKRIAKYHPDVTVKVVAKKEYQDIAKWSSIIPGWETKPDWSQQKKEKPCR